MEGCVDFNDEFLDMMYNPVDRKVYFTHAKLER